MALAHVVMVPLPDPVRFPNGNAIKTELFTRSAFYLIRSSDFAAIPFICIAMALDESASALFIADFNSIFDNNAQKE